MLMRAVTVIGLRAEMRIAKARFPEIVYLTCGP
jgi:hypothetical protein